MEEKKPRKVAKAENRAAQFGRISDRDWKTHYELFNHLIAAGPTMHGTPGDRPKKTH